MPKMKTLLQNILYPKAMQAFRNLPRTLTLIWECSPHWTIASILLIAIQGFFPLATLYVLKLLIDEISTTIQSNGSSVSVETIGWLVGMLAGLGLLRVIVGSLNGLVTRAQAQAISDHIQSLLLQKSVEVDLQYFENSKYYDAFHRAQQDSAWRPKEILFSLLHMGQNGISLLAMMGLLFWLHWSIVLILLVSILPEIVVRLHFADKFFHWERSRTSEERQAGYFNWVLTRDFYAKEIRLFHLGTLFKDWFDDIRRRLRKERLSLDTRKAFADMASQVFAVLAIFGVLGFLAIRTTQGLLTLGDMVMYFQALQRGMEYLKNLGANVTQFYEHNLFLSHLYEFFAVKKIIKDPAAPCPLLPSPGRTIVFDHVQFYYPDSSGKVLNNLSFTVEPGEHIALVGENGAGKSTLVKLLCRLYDPTEGRIMMNGVDLRDFKVEDLRKEISVVFQDFARYQLTARDNIWVGDIHVPPQSSHFQIAAEQSGIHDRISRLGAAYDTMLGRWFDGGEELSVGEWQKVALARAFFRNAPIIILDEPSSALDAKAEFDLFQRFHELAKGRTAILISHRLSTVKMVDRIYVLEHGRIVEAGTHDQLVEQNGEYARMYALQAQYYQT